MSENNAEEFLVDSVRGFRHDDFHKSEAFRLIKIGFDGNEGAIERDDDDDDDDADIAAAFTAPLVRIRTCNFSDEDEDEDDDEGAAYA